MKKICLRLVCTILLLAGAGLILYPNIQSMLADLNGAEVVKEIQEKRNNVQQQYRSEETDKEEGKYARLLQDMQAYNKEIYQNHQSGIVDAWSFEQSEFTLSDYGAVEEAVGYLTIDAMDIQLPVYLGTTNENLSKGAAVLGQTSMPIGGENTNCVIAGHRGWKGIPMFVDIEKLKPGDSVILDNLWGTLRYQVSDIRVIDPTDTDAVKIQEGKDMVTLITCHPYRHHYQRYVVYCERVNEESGLSQDTGKEISEEDEEEYVVQQKQKVQSSQEAIEQERFLNKGGLIIVGGAMILYLLSFFFRKRKP